MKTIYTFPFGKSDVEQLSKAEQPLSVGALVKTGSTTDYPDWAMALNHGPKLLLTFATPPHPRGTDEPTRQLVHSQFNI